MTLQDPYYIAKDEVCRALNKTRGLYGRLQDLQDLQMAAAGGTSSLHSSGLPPLDPTEELEWTANELRNALRSIEWDIEDLDDTIRIVEKNPSKFRTDNRDMTVRRKFIQETRGEIKIMKDKMNMNKDREYNRTSKQQPVIINDSPNKSPPPIASTHGAAKYTKLESDIDSPNRLYIKGISNPNSILDQHDDFKIMSNNTGGGGGGGGGGLNKPVTQQFQFELDERQFMLDDFGNEMEIITDTKLDTTMKKMAKVFHLSNGRTKWITIGLLTAITLILVISFLRK